MKNFLKPALFLFLITIKFNVFAQEEYIPGYWVTSNSDTVIGLIKNTILKGKFIYLKRSEKSKPIKRSADEIYGIYQNDVLVISKYTIFNDGQKENIFVEALSLKEGIGLFRGKHDALGKVYVIYKNEQFNSLNISDLSGSYSYLYGDCDEMDFNRKHVYTEKNILDTFEKYCSCKGFQTNADVKLRKDRFQLYLGPKVGYAFGKFIFVDNTYFSRGDYSSFQSPEIGMTAKMAFTKRLSCQSEIDYITKKSSSDSINTPPVLYPEAHSKVEFDISVLNIKLYGTYSFIQRKQFSAELGFGIHYGILTDWSFSQTVVDPESRAEDPAKADFNNSNEIGGFALVGAAYMMKNENQVQLNVRYSVADLDYGIFYTVSAGERLGSSSLDSRMVEISLSYLFKLK